MRLNIRRYYTRRLYCTVRMRLNSMRFDWLRFNCMRLPSTIKAVRGISLKEVRVDRFLEGAVAFRSTRILSTLGTHLKISLQICVTRG